MTPLRPSIALIASAGTSRRRRRKPERTASASGTSGEVPYIGASTRPITRPRASATRYPVVEVRSIAAAAELTVKTLFPGCERKKRER